MGCDQCIHVCPHHASCKVSELTPEALLDRVAETFPFIQGITVSGGECMLYADFLTEFFRLVKAAGKTCLIDSNGILDFRQYPELLQLCDGVMLDMKAIDEMCIRDSYIVLGLVGDTTALDVDWLKSFTCVKERCV